MEVRTVHGAQRTLREEVVTLYCCACSQARDIRGVMVFWSGVRDSGWGRLLRLGWLVLCCFDYNGVMGGQMVCGIRSWTPFSSWQDILFVIWARA